MLSNISDKKLCPIGFFDSGVGGISVLKQAVSLMKNENFIYLGDSKNAPYGTKSLQEVKELSFNAVEFLMKYNVKAVVVACNTATSAAINDLRNRYKGIPVIGIEPALKPAVELKRKGKIVIMATPMTLAERKFSNLMRKYESTVQIEPLPCPGLVEMIESEVTEGDIVNEFLRKTLKNVLDEDIAAVVLGCTHYPFVKKELSNVLGGDIPIIDGSKGTAKQLKKLLAENGTLNESEGEGTVKIFNSLESTKIVDFSYRLLGNRKLNCSC